MKKNLTVILILAAVFLVAIGTFLVIRGRNKVTTEIEEEQVSQTIETPLADRPFVALIPRADGKEFTMEISRIKNAKSIEYEMVYLSQGLSRGVIGSIETNGESEVSRDLLLGTCSKDVCKYDEGVEEGTLTLRFRGEDGVRKFMADFRLQQGETDLSSLDDKFKLTGKFPSTAYYLTMSTIGLPEETTEIVLGQPYGVFTAGSSAIKGLSLKMTFEAEESPAKLFFFNGKTSVEQTEAKIEDKTISLTVDSLGVFFATQ